MNRPRWLTPILMFLIGALLFGAYAVDAQLAAGTVRIRDTANGSITVGQKTMAASVPVTLASDQTSMPVTPAANSSVNLSQYGGAATTLGQKTMTASMPVVLSSDQSSLPTVPGALTTLTTGQQAVTATATVLPTVVAKQVCIKVLAAGTQTVYYGPTGVTTATGQELQPGDSRCAPADNVNRIFVIAAGTGSTVAYEAWN